MSNIPYLSIFPYMRKLHEKNIYTRHRVLAGII